MRKRRAIIHIGTAKTGSTTIQRMLVRNRAALLERGFAFPESPGESNHFRLAIYAGDTGKVGRLVDATGEAGGRGYVAERFRVELGREMRALPDDVHTCIFSNEHCYRKISTPAAARTLKRLLDEHFDEYLVLAYLRRQDEMAVSLYSTRMRNGDDRARVVPDLAEEPEFALRFDWFAMLERWAEAFGREAVAPRLFAREAFAGGDLLRDFCRACGLGDSEGLEFPEVKNGSITAAAQEFLRRLNVVMRPGEGADGKAPPFVRHFLDEHLAGRGRMPSRAQAMAFAAGFDAANERLRAAYFPGRAAMFPADFSRYPEVEDPPPSDAEVLEVALRLTAHQARQAPEQQADRAFRRGEELLKEGDAAQARRLLNRALAAQPTHVGALRALAGMSSGEEDRAEALARLDRALAEEPEREEFLRLRRRLVAGGEDPTRGSSRAEAVVGGADAARAAPAARGGGRRRAPPPGRRFPRPPDDALGPRAGP